MKVSIFFLVCCTPFFFTACKKDDILTSKRGEAQVRYIDFNRSCNENLELLNGQLVQSYSEEFKSTSFYGNTWDFTEFANLPFGTTLTIKYKILEEVPYPLLPIDCNKWPGIPIEILKVELN